MAKRVAVTVPSAPLVRRNWIVALEPVLLDAGDSDDGEGDLPMVPMPEDVSPEDDDDMDFGGAGDALGILLGMMPLLFLFGMA